MTRRAAQKHITPQTGDTVFLPGATYLDFDSGGEHGVVTRVGAGYVVVDVGGDDYDFAQFPPEEQVYGDHPSAAGDMNDLYVVLERGDTRPLKDTAENNKTFRKWQAKNRKYPGMYERLRRKIDLLH